MRRIYRTGFAVAAGILSASCGDDRELAPYEFTVRRDTPVYSSLTATFETSPRIGTLSAGQLVVAQCYYPSATLGSDSVMLRTSSGLSGLAPILNIRVLNDPNNFDRSLGDMRAELPTCQP